MFSNLVVAHSQLLPEAHVVTGYWLIVQSPEYQLLFIIALFYQHPHPLAHAKFSILDFDFDVIPWFVLSHRARPDVANKP